MKLETEVAFYLIEEVRNRPWLWDQRHKDHGNLEWMGQGWLDVHDLLVIKFGIAKVEGNEMYTSKDVKRRWVNLRDTFRRKLRESNDHSARSLSCWAYGSAMSFLKEPVMGQSILEPRPDPLKQEPEDRNLSRVLPETTSNESDMDDSNNDMSQVTATNGKRRSESSSSSDSFGEKPGKIARSNENSERFFKSAMSGKGDEFDDFGNMMAKILRRSPRIRSNNLMASFQILITRTENEDNFDPLTQVIKK